MKPLNSYCSRDGEIVVFKHDIPQPVDDRAIKERTQQDVDRRIFRDVVVSSESIDADGDIVRVKGAELDRYRKNPVVLFAHNRPGTGVPPIPVGTALRLRSTRVPAQGKTVRGLSMDFQFAPEETAQFIDEVHNVWAAKVLRAVSIGFRIKESRRIDQDGKPAEGSEPVPGIASMFGGNEFLRWELLENSLVAVGSNPDALQRSLDMTSSLKNYLEALDYDPAQLEDKHKTYFDTYVGKAGSSIDLLTTALAAYKEDDVPTGFTEDLLERYGGKIDVETDAGAELRKQDGGPLSEEAMFANRAQNEGGREVKLDLKSMSTSASWNSANTLEEAQIKPDDVARLIKQAHIEQCPKCSTVTLYCTEPDAFINHRTPKGKRCAGAKLEDVWGPKLKTTLKDLANLGARNAVREDLLARHAIKLPPEAALGEMRVRFDQLLNSLTEASDPIAKDIREFSEFMEAAGVALRDALSVAVDDNHEDQTLTSTVVEPVTNTLSPETLKALRPVLIQIIERLGLAEAVSD